MDLETLRATLGSHSPIDAKEAADLDEVLRVLDAGGAGALRRSHFHPGHLTASAFVRRENALLLVHHERLGRWLQPGGHIEPEDGSVEEAARRETVEETGISDLRSLGLVDIDVHEIPAARGEPLHLHLDVRWAFEATGEPIAGDGVSDARWVDARALGALDTDESVLRGAVKLGVIPFSPPGNGEDPGRR